jgi:creatinine amidohydrolase
MPPAAGRPGWRSGHQRLEARVRALPGALREGARSRSVPPVSRAVLACDAIVTTGIGTSGAHARFLAEVWNARVPIPARFTPPSALLGAPPPDASHRTLIVISQGLAPNARLLLRYRASWRHIVVLTAATEDGARRAGDTAKAECLADLRTTGVGLLPFVAGENEYDTLVRVTGAMAGYWSVLQLVESVAPSPPDRAPDLDAICDAIAAAPARLDVLDPPLDPAWLATAPAFLTSGTYGAMVENLRLKVLEGMLLPAPPIWDLLDVAHGPYQQAFDGPATLLALTRPDAAHEDDLLARLGAMLDPARHRLVRLAATLPGPLAVFEHEALVNELLLRAIAARGIDQVDWPGRGMDAPLYALDHDVPRGPVRRLEDLTWLELERLLATGPHTAVVPLGATEQHGPHLPLATDTWIADALARRLCARFDDAVQCPTLAVGCSREHLDFPGTLDVRDATLEAVLTDLVASLRRHGFARAFVFSAHGGNCAALRAMLPALRAAAAPMRVDAFTDLDGLTRTLHAAGAALGVDAGAAGHHAGEVETSMMLGLRPGAVRSAAIAPGLIAHPDDPQALFYPSLRPNAPSGSVGDASAASAAHAARYLEAWSALLAAAYRGETKSA